MIVRATLAALSFVSHSPTAVAAVVVSSPLHILVQQVLRPLERQLLMVRHVLMDKRGLAVMTDEAFEVEAASFAAWREACRAGAPVTCSGT